jgi:hypothetical protein
MRLTSTGLGIGTSSPTHRLVVQRPFDGSGNPIPIAIFRDTETNGNAFSVRSQAGLINFLSTWLTSAVDAGFSFTPTTSGGVQTEAMRITSAGNVGIGTSSPVGRLNVAGADTSNTIGSAGASLNITNTDIAAFGRTVNLNFTVSNGNLTDRRLAGISAIYTNFGTTTGGALAFATDNGSGSFAERARISSAGYLLASATASDISNSHQITAINAAVINSTAVGDQTAALCLSGGIGTQSNTAQASNVLVLRGNSGLSSAPGDLIKGYGGNGASTLNFRVGHDGGMFSAGNVGVGITTPVPYNAGARIIQSHNSGGAASELKITNTSTGTSASAGFTLLQSGLDTYVWNGSNSFMAFGTNNTERARIDSSGNLLVGATSQAFGEKFNVTAGNQNGALIKNTQASENPILVWNASTSEDSAFIAFATETSYTGRGTINYNRGSGLVAYNVTSDYRAKDIIGPVVDSGALIDSVPVYMGKMKGATQERPMFIAHETPAYAHTGEKDAVDADGKPVYQQMDASSLIPVMWAEIQSLRARLAAANI